MRWMLLLPGAIYRPGRMGDEMKHHNNREREREIIVHFLRERKKKQLGGKKPEGNQELGKGIKAVFGYLGFKSN